MQACSIAGVMARAIEYGWADKAAAPADEANLLGGGGNPNPGIVSACLALLPGPSSQHWSDGRQLFPLPQSQCSGLNQGN